jgi:putative transposase
MDETRTTNGVVYRGTYHVVWCRGTRRPVIQGAIDQRLKQVIRQVCAEKDAPIVELDTVPERIHPLLVCHP